MSTDAAGVGATTPDGPADQPPARRLSKPLLLGAIGMVVILALALGLAWFLHRSSTSTMREEIASLKKQITEKDKTLAEAQSQVANLSLQMKALREYAVARSSGNVTTQKTETTESKPTAESAPADAGTGKKAGAHEMAVTPGSEEKTGERAKAPASPPDAAHPVERKVKRVPTSQTCDLIGKSPEEQAAILKRCVELID